MVGINVSPLIIGHEGRAGSVMENYVRLVEYLLEATDMNVALIPHVVWPGNDDRKPLGALRERFRHTGRVIMVGDAPCFHPGRIPGRLEPDGQWRHAEHYRLHRF